MQLSRPFQDTVTHALRILIAVAVGITSSALAGGHEGSLLERLIAVDQNHTNLCNAALDEASSLARIAAMARAVRSQLDIAHTPESVVKALNGIVFGPSGIRSSQDLHDPCNLLLSGVLARGQGYCVGVAAVYLAVAEELNLPIYAVGTPSHVLLRFDDGRTRINIETDGGRSVPDEQYVSQNRIAPASLKKGVFLENLSTDRFLAQVHNNLGVIYSERREFERAAAEYEEALRLDKRLPAAWYNSGKDLQEQGQLKGAIRAFTKALNLHPNDTWALNNRAMAYREMGQVDLARQDLELSLRIDPQFQQARQNLANLGDAKP
jgi:regulator of sirC expression with transglutaminase-like and TPR domain